MHQVVAGSGGNTIDLALLSTGINDMTTYINVSVPLKHSTKALSLALMENPTTYATHPCRNCCRQPISYCTTFQERLTLAGHPYPLPPSAKTCDVLYSNEHCSTYGTQHPPTTNKSTARTSIQRAPTAITLFPLSTTLSLEQCTSSCHTFPLRRAVGFICASKPNTIIGGNIFIRVLPVSPFSPYDAPGILRHPHPEGEPCKGVFCTIRTETYRRYIPPVLPVPYTSVSSVRHQCQHWQLR